MRQFFTSFKAKRRRDSVTVSPRAAERNVTPVVLENLESRRLMSSITVSSLVADNRGQVYINLDSHGATIDRTSISKSSVLLYSAGADAIYGTADDVRLSENVAFNTNINRIIVTTKVAPGVGYRLRLFAARIKTTQNDILDGDFSGTYPTGNGSPGGDFNALTKIDKTNTPVIRITTSLGSLALRLRGDVAPATVNWFEDRANRGFYDNVMFNAHTNNSSDNFLETGIIKVGSDNSYFVTDPTDANKNAKNPERSGLTNIQATVAMSRLPYDTAHEGNGFIFNMQSNHVADTTFGSVISGFNVVQQIAALQTITLAPEHGFQSGDTSTVPVVHNVNHTTYHPYTDSVFMTRTAVQMRVVAMA